ALAIGIDRDDLVFAGNAAALIDEIDRDLSANGAGNRATGGEWAGQVVDDTDPNGLRLGAGKTPGKAHCSSCRNGLLKQRTACGGHGVPPWLHRFCGWYSCLGFSIWRTGWKVNVGPVNTPTRIVVTVGLGVR